MGEYERLAAAERPKRVADHRGAWERLTPLLGVNGTVRERVQAFAAAKNVSLEALVALGTRVRVDKAGAVELAWGYPHNGAVTAIKFRPLADKQRYALEPSVFLQPLVIGRRDSLDWLLAEGETDAARLFDLAGDRCAILVLPAGALTFKPQWAGVIPRGATVGLAHDADEPGDKGAEKAARIIGGRTVRLRPPVEDGDWCDWPGTRDEFVELVRTAGAGNDVPFALPLEQFIEERIDTPVALVGDEQVAVLPGSGLVILFARGGKGKTTLTVDAGFHFASGIAWLGFPVERPLRILLVENEGPREPFRQKLDLKFKVWPHPITGAIHVATVNWGAVTLKNSDHVCRLRDYVLEHEIDLVIGDPLDSLGLDGVGSPEDTREFMRRLGETGLFRDVACWLLAHARKEAASDELDEIPGAWGGRPDTMLMLDKRDGNRARLSFPKIRWSRRGSRAAYLLAFDPDTEGFSVVREEEPEERDYLAEITNLLGDDRWRTAKEIAASKEAGGIGANVDTVKTLLSNNPDHFESRTGDAAKELGRNQNATLWGLTRPSASPESHADSQGADLGLTRVTQPYRSHSSRVSSQTSLTKVTQEAESDE